MAEAQYDFASVDAIDAESIGTPGKRTFRLRILRGDESAALWMEKQQLAALGEAIPRLLEQLIGLGMAGEGRDAVGGSQMFNHFQRAAPDGASGPKNCDALV